MKRSYEITQEKIDAYGRINGDNDILHYDHDYAVERGFKGTLAHGLMVSGYAVDMAVEKWGRDFFYKGYIDVRFRGPMIPGDTVEIEIDDGKLESRTRSGEALMGAIGLRND